MGMVVDTGMAAAFTKAGIMVVGMAAVVVRDVAGIAARADIDLEQAGNNWDPGRAVRIPRHANGWRGVEFI